MNCQKFVVSVERWEKGGCTSLAQAMFELQWALGVNKEFSMGGTGPLSDATDMTTASAGDLSNLLVMYCLVEVLAIASGKSSRGLVPRHNQIPGLSDPKFKVVLFNSLGLVRVCHLASIWVSLECCLDFDFDIGSLCMSVVTSKWDSTLIMLLIWPQMRASVQADI